MCNLLSVYVDISNIDIGWASSILQYYDALRLQLYYVNPRAPTVDVASS